MLQSTLQFQLLVEVHLFRYVVIFGTLFVSALIASTLFANVSANNPPNVILIIGDGMDDQQITIARNYLKGPRGRLLMDTLPVRSSVQVLTVDEFDPDIPLYVAESAGSGTAMATGEVTSRARIATRPTSDQAIPTILELAQQANLKTGVVTTASVTDATPAVFMSHINIRMCENPDEMVTEDYDCHQHQKSNGGAGSIAEQIAQSNLDIVLGGGQTHFAVKAEGLQTPVLELAQTSGFTTVSTLEQLQQTKADRVLGLFAPEHLPVRLHGDQGRSGEKPDVSLLNSIHWSLGDVTLPEPMNCVANPEFKQTPSLAMMTQTAIDHLTRANNDGFVLVIESASIDKKSHARDACGSIGELDQLEEALAVALEFADRNGDTLVIVTADHSQAAQIVPNGSLFSAFGVPVFTPGSLVRINMPFGGTMAVNYATNDFFAEEHTGAAVPLYANRADIELPIFITQPDVFALMKSFLKL
ncbi:MAG: alkaline phosphatase [Limisphaerales bacterium]|jgi:alkaline phosphatase